MNITSIIKEVINENQTAVVGEIAMLAKEICDYIVTKIRLSNNTTTITNLKPFYIDEVIRDRNQYKTITNIIDNDISVHFVDKMSTPAKYYSQENNKAIVLDGSDTAFMYSGDCDKIRVMLTHELQHAYDDIISKGRYKTDKKSRNYYKKYGDNTAMTFDRLVSYINLPHEYRAITTEILSTINPLNKTFEDYRKEFISKFEMYNNLSPNNKKKVNKIIYVYWNNI
jgi:hypothetical protein